MFNFFHLFWKYFIFLQIIKQTVPKILSYNRSSSKWNKKCTLKKLLFKIIEWKQNFNALFPFFFHFFGVLLFSNSFESILFRKRTEPNWMIEKFSTKSFEWPEIVPKIENETKKIIKIYSNYYYVLRKVYLPVILSKVVMLKQMAVHQHPCRYWKGVVLVLSIKIKLTPQKSNKKACLFLKTNLFLYLNCIKNFYLFRCYVYF